LPATNKRRHVSAADLAPYPWALYQRDREILQKLMKAVRDEGGTPPRVMVESGSVLVALEMLKGTCPSGALHHRTLRHFAPVRALILAIDEICARISRAAKAIRGRTGNAISSAVSPSA
jgi:DNA-binding transcriptional LysR family regulator